eukprot:1188584-Prorocentrum_minimum.AAC.1
MHSISHFLRRGHGHAEHERNRHAGGWRTQFYLGPADYGMSYVEFTEIIICGTPRGNGTPRGSGKPDLREKLDECSSIAQFFFINIRFGTSFHAEWTELTKCCANLQGFQPGTGPMMPPIKPEEGSSFFQPFKAPTEAVKEPEGIKTDLTADQQLQIVRGRLGLGQGCAAA